MRPELFEELAPVCPRCLHHAGLASPIEIAVREEMRDGHLWHGTLHCSNHACWLEFPVIDGVPLLFADPAGVLRTQAANVLFRHDLPPVLESLLGDALGPGETFDTIRYHLSLYGGDHFAGWGVPGTPGVAALIGWGLDRLGEPPQGAVLDLGGSVGRGGWELGLRTGRPAIVTDLNLSMLRFGARLALEGEAELSLRRVGLVYDRITVTLPEAARAVSPDFWAVDAGSLPFRTGTVATLSAINLVDCTASPTTVIAEMARVIAPGGGVVVATPHDWSPQAADPSQWLGGHSQRGPDGGAPEPRLKAGLASVGLGVVAEETDLSWRLRLHARATMEYRVHAIAAERKVVAEDEPFGELG